MAASFGWDLGGANLKVAQIEDGRVVSVAQIPCPAIADPAKFNQALEAALKACPADRGSHAVTMTGELSDVFPSRAAGVAYLVGLMRKETGEDTLFYSLREGLIGAGADQALTQAVEQGVLARFLAHQSDEIGNAGRARGEHVGE